MNGGFNQFFWNPSAEFAEDVAPALRELQANEASDIFDQALLVANVELSARTELKSDGSWEAFAKSNVETKLRNFDKTFCTLAEKFPSLRATFIRKHENQFVPATD